MNNLLEANLDALEMVYRSYITKNQDESPTLKTKTSLGSEYGGSIGTGKRKTQMQITDALDFATEDIDLDIPM